MPSRPAARSASWSSPRQVDEAATVVLAHDIAHRIENEMQYPGQVKVVVIRESRAVGIAK